MKDDLFSRDAAVRDFVFDEEIAAVFDDMLSRSIPFYSEIQRMAVELSCRVLQGGSGAVYDIGCSTGNTLMQLISALPADHPIDFFGVEPSDAMRAQFERKIAESATDRSVKLLSDPVERIHEMPGARVILMLFTLQFVRPISRPNVLRMVYDSLQAGGIFLLGEKVLADDRELSRTYIDLHREYKRRNGYSDSEIARKREALENVLVPYRHSENRALLERAGFGPVDEVFRWYNFVLYVACKT